MKPVCKIYVIVEDLEGYKYDKGYLKRLKENY